MPLRASGAQRGAPGGRKAAQRLRKGENPSEHLLETCDMLSEIILGLRNAPDTCEIDEEDRSFRNLRR